MKRGIRDALVLNLTPSTDDFSGRRRMVAKLCTAIQNKRDLHPRYPKSNGYILARLREGIDSGNMLHPDACR